MPNLVMVNVNNLTTIMFDSLTRPWICLAPLILLLMAALLTQTSEGGKKTGTVILPGDIKAVVDEPFNVTCQFQRSGHSMSHYRNLKLEISYILQNGTLPNINPEYIKKVNRTTLVLLYPRMTEDMNHAVFNCSSRWSWPNGTEGTEFSGGAYTYVGQRPLKPRIIQTVVSNWSNLTVTFETNGFNIVYDTNYTLKIKQRSEAVYQMSFCPPFRNKSHMECIIPDFFQRVGADKHVSMKVYGKNDVGKVTSDAIHVDLSRVVKPGKVLGFNILVVNDSVTARIVSPRANQSLVYQLVVHASSYCLENNSATTYSQDIFSTGHLTTFTLGSDVPSDCFITAEVRARPLPEGLWGDTLSSDPQEFTTPHRVPLAPPLLYNGSFEVLATEDNASDTRRRDILLFFKLPHHTFLRGKVKKYRITVVDNSKSLDSLRVVNVTDSRTVSFVRVDGLLTSSSYTFTVNAATVVGYNETMYLPVVTVPASSDMVLLTTRDNVTVVSNDDTHDDTRVTVSWNTGGGGRLDGRGVVVRQIVYWCLSKEGGGVGGGVCLNKVEIREVSPNVSWYDILLLPGSEQPRDYRYGLSLEYVDGRMSGINWIRQLFDATSDPVESVLARHNETDTSVLFEIRREECSVYGSCGLVYRYIVHWCPVGNDSSNSCLGESQTVNVAMPSDELSSIETLTGLQPDQHYLIHVQSVFVRRSINISSPLRVRTKKVLFVGPNLWWLLFVAVFLCLLVPVIFCAICCCQEDRPVYKFVRRIHHKFWVMKISPPDVLNAEPSQPMTSEDYIEETPPPHRDYHHTESPLLQPLLPRQPTLPSTESGLNSNTSMYTGSGSSSATYIRAGFRDNDTPPQVVLLGPGAPIIRTDTVDGSGERQTATPFDPAGTSVADEVEEEQEQGMFGNESTNQEPLVQPLLAESLVQPLWGENSMDSRMSGDSGSDYSSSATYNRVVIHDAVEDPVLFLDGRGAPIIMTNETIECTPETGPLLCDRERPSTSAQCVMDVPAPTGDQTIVNIPERDCLAEVNSVQLDIRDTNMGVFDAELGENSGQRFCTTDLLRQPSPVLDERLEVDADLFDSYSSDDSSDPYKSAQYRPKEIQHPEFTEPAADIIMTTTPEEKTCTTSGGGGTAFSTSSSSSSSALDSADEIEEYSNFVNRPSPPTTSLFERISVPGQSTMGAPGIITECPGAAAGGVEILPRSPAHLSSDIFELPTLGELVVPESVGFSGSFPDDFTANDGVGRPLNNADDNDGSSSDNEDVKFSGGNGYAKAGGAYSS